jgi:microcystin degradation protein MlrC
MSARIGIAGFMQESNSFAPRRAEIPDFDIRRGSELPEFFADTNAEVAGFLDGCKEEGWDQVPLMSANAISGGPLAKNCFEQICAQLISSIEAQPMDGLLLALHGAMSVEHFPSGDAEIVRRVRQALPANCPVVVSHDFHANLAPSFLANVNGLSAYRTYPHVDQRETGQRACTMLARSLAGETAHHWRLPIPLLLSPETSTTFQEPLRPVMERLTSDFLESAGDYASLFCVQPWLDFSPVSSNLVLSQFGGPKRDTAARMRELAASVWATRRQFQIEWVSPDDLVNRIQATGLRPVLVSEAPDSPTGGASGDHTGLLSCLLPFADRLKSCIYLVDPEFALRARAAGHGAQIEGFVGATIDSRFSQPVSIRGRVEHLSEGIFHAKGPAFHGRQFSMGATAVVAIGRLRIVVASKPVMMIDPELYRSQDVEPADQDVIGIKSALLFRPAYESVSRTVLHLDMPGPCRGRLEKVDFRKINRPIYPVDDFEWTPPEPDRIAPR